MTEIEQRVVAVDGFAYGVIGADLHVFGSTGTPVYLLATWVPPAAADDDWLREMPSRMLNARREIVDFTGRADELGNLSRWRDQGPLLAVHWLHGTGGQGKTRLAARFAAGSVAAGWKVITAVQGSDADRPEPGSQDLRPDGSAGLLVIIDYADRWRMFNLTWLFKNTLLHRPGLAVRVLMIGRTLDGWPALRALLDQYQPRTSSQHLADLDGDEQRARMFHAARRGFATRYGIDDPTAIAPPGPLNGPGMGLTLAVHMAALVAVDAWVNDVRPPSDMDGLTIYLLDRERLHWERLHGHGVPDTEPVPHGFRTEPAVMNRAVFAAALTGAVPQRTGIAVLSECAVEHPARVLADHAYCYPPSSGSGGSEATVLEPLYPDRLAEDFLALTLPGHVVGYPAHAWATSATTTLLADASRPWTSRALVYLTAAAQRWPHLITGHIDPLLRADPRIAVAAGGAALTNLAVLTDLDVELLQAILVRLPWGQIDLTTGAAAVTTRVVDWRLERTDDPTERAELLVYLHNRLDEAGLMDRALTALEQAAALTRPGTTLRTTILATLAPALAAVHRTAEATRIGEEAIDLLRAAASDPATTGMLADTLHNHAMTLSLGGRADDAVVAGEEALRLYVALADRGDDGIAVAGARESLAVMLARSGQPQRAVKIRREIVAEAQRAGVDADLAAGLSDLGAALCEAGRAAEALPVLREAADTFRELARVSPDRFERDLALTYTQISAVLDDAGDAAGALAALEEAVTISRRRLAVDRSQEPAFAVLLSRLAQSLSANARWDDALAAELAGNDLLRRHVGADPELIGPLLARSYGGLVVRYLERGDIEASRASHRAAEALRSDAPRDPADERLDRFRGLVDMSPEIHRPMLVKALDDLAEQLSDAGDPTRSITLRLESVAIQRELARADPEQFEEDLAWSLCDLSTIMGRAGLPADAMTTIEEAVDILRHRATNAEPESVSDLCTGLEALSIRLRDVGRWSESLAAAAEVVDLQRTLEDGPDASFASNLLHLSVMYALADDPARADLTWREASELLWPPADDPERDLEWRAETVNLYRMFAERMPVEYQPNLVVALAQQAVDLAVCDRLEAAAEAYEEAETTRQRMTVLDPTVFAPAFARLTAGQAAVRARLDRRDRPGVATAK